MLSYWIDTLVLKNRGKYLRCFAAFPLQGKTNACSRGSKKDFRRRCRGDLRQVKTYQVPITTPILRITLFAICLSFSSPTLHPCRFILPFFPFASFCLLLVCLCVGLVVTMSLPKSIDLHHRRLEEIENNVRSFMSLQFEHNNFFRNELKEQKSFMEYMNKELNDMSKEFYGLKSQFSHLENLVGRISDKQATLINKMAAKPESNNNHEDLKVINVTPIESFISNINLDDDGTRDESTLVRRHPKNSEFLDLDAKFGKSGIEEVKTLDQ